MSFAENLAAAAEAEYEKYKGLLETKSPLCERIGDYWAARGMEYDGSDRDQPWSAAFISMMVQLADPHADFHFTVRHSSYVGRAIWNEVSQGRNSFRGYRVDQAVIRRGDILGMNRGDQPRITYEGATPPNGHDYPSYESHADIVVSVDDAGIHTIGGNVDSKVGRKTFAPDQDKLLVNTANSNQAVFVVVRRL